MLAYDDLLRQNEMKVTPQRLAIVKALEEHGHLNIDELYDLITKQFPSISLATVYKNLNSMNESNFTQEVKLPNQKSKYELTKGAHSHVICRVCGKVEDVVIDTKKLIGLLDKDKYSEVEVHYLVYSGICKDCQD